MQESYYPGGYFKLTRQTTVILGLKVHFITVILLFVLFLSSLSFLSSLLSHVYA